MDRIFKGIIEPNNKSSLDTSVTVTAPALIAEPLMVEVGVFHLIFIPVEISIWDVQRWAWVLRNVLNNTN